MYFELYQQETEKIAERNGVMLHELHIKLEHTAELSMIEEQAMLHALQVIIENAIGKARHLLKANNEKVPISAYDLFERLQAREIVSYESLEKWKKIIGLRNTIVHEYMKVNISLIKTIVNNEQYKFVLDFLNNPFTEFIKREM